MPSLNDDDATEAAHEDVLRVDGAPTDDEAPIEDINNINNDDDDNNKSKRRKRKPKTKKKMQPLQIADPNRPRSSRKRKTINPENPIASMDTLDDGLNRLRKIVMALNAIMVPLSPMLGMGVHTMALLGTLQLDLTLLLPALVYFTVIWCLWSLSILAQPPHLAVLYPFLMAAQGRLIYRLLVVQMEQQQAAFDELAPMFADQPTYKDSEEELEDDGDISPTFVQEEEGVADMAV